MKEYLAIGTIICATPLIADEASFGVSGDTSAGCDIPDVYVAYYGAPLDGFDVAGRVRQGGNRACKSSTSADISIERDFGHISLELGYDQRGVSFAGPSTDGVDDIFYGKMQAASASVNLDFNVGRLNVEAGWDVPGEAPRIAVSTRMRLLSLDADFTKFPSADGLLSTYSLRWQRDFGPTWGVEVYASMTQGISNAPDPIDWRSDTGRLPADPPDYAYSYGIGFTRTLGGK